MPSFWTSAEQWHQFRGSYRILPCETIASIERFKVLCLHNWTGATAAVNLEKEPCLSLTKIYSLMVTWDVVFRDASMARTDKQWREYFLIHTSLSSCVEIFSSWLDEWWGLGTLWLSSQTNHHLQDLLDKNHPISLESKKFEHIRFLSCLCSSDQFRGILLRVEASIFFFSIVCPLYLLVSDNMRPKSSLASSSTERTSSLHPDTRLQETRLSCNTPSVPNSNNHRYY